MARPQYDAVAPAANVPSRSRAARVVAAAATVMFACAAVVALVGVSTQTPKSSVMAQTAVATPKASVTMLAEYFLKHGSTMTDKAALSAVKAWTSHPEMETAALMGTKDAATMMLALTPSRHMSLAEGSALCEKKDKIIALFDRLLSKLGGEELAANITYGKVDKEFKDTLSTWLDAESHYRLTVEQTKEAKQGASYASDEYEKWKTAYKKAKADLEATLARHAEERTSLGEEREVIKEILRYLGVLHDVKATEKSIAAGGRDSKIDEETGVSEVKAVKTATLKAKMAKLQSLVLKTKQPGAMQKLAQIQKLPVYSETEEVARVLKEMLADLQTRLDVLEDVDKKAKEIADEAYNKMVEWEGKLVALSDQADKAKEKMMAEKLEREKLAGDKNTAQKVYNVETDAYHKVITPYVREIYVITQIKIKITEHCERLAKGEESTFGQ